MVKRFTKEDSVFLVVDLQERLMPAISEREWVIKNTVKAVKGFKEFEIPLILVEQYPKGLGETVHDIKEAIGDNYSYCEKNEFSAFDSIKEVLQSFGKHNIFIASCETHICMYQTVRDLLNASYNVFVLSDCTSSRTVENRENGLYLLDKMGATIINTETVLFDLLGSSKHEKFKEVSKIIK